MNTTHATCGAHTRRSVLGGMAGMAALGAAGLSCVRADEALAEGWDRGFDVLVLGGGIGGCIAGYTAATGGARTAVVEAGAVLGGTFLISGGFMHTGKFSTVENLLAMPSANQALCADYLERWSSFGDWLLETGAPNVAAYDYGKIMYGVTPDYAGRQEFIDYFGQTVTDAGGEVMLNTKAVRLLQAEDGTVNGAVVVDASGACLRLGAKAVILACGGFSASPVLKQLFLGGCADQSVPRAVPYNKGDGLRMALEAGAQMASGAGRFYGNLAPWPNVIPGTGAEYEAVSKDDIASLFSTFVNNAKLGILVNIEGERFCDEASARVNGGACLASEEILRQPMGHGWLILDEAAAPEDAFALYDKFGATTVKAESLEELAAALAEQGVRESALLRTFAEYNNEDPEDFTIAHSGRMGDTPGTKPLEQPPFYAVRVTGAPSAMFGGVKIDTSAQVIGVDDQPIPALYATACCAGGFGYDDYFGSLALSAVYGKAAAESALAYLQA